jgi:NB-ARC domain-containing protein
VSREDLVARVWGRVHVDDGTLRAHVSKLRNALGRTKGGASLIRTESGRGYRLAAPITLEAHPSATVQEHHTLVGVPQALSSLIGREAAINHLAALVRQNRLVTVAGAGGIGKTRLAQVVSARLERDFPDGVVFVDLASVAEPERVPTAVATALGKVVLSGNPTEMLVADLKDRRVLILLDNCEHLVDAAGLFCETVVRGALRVRIIATSREMLRVEGEWTYRVDPLDVPSVDLASAQQALSYSAIQLFAERAAAAGGFAFGDREDPMSAPSAAPWTACRSQSRWRRCRQMRWA